MELYETVTVADLIIGDKINTASGWATVKDFADVRSGRRLEFAGTKKPITRSLDTPADRVIGAVEPGHIGGYYDAAKVSAVLTGTEPSQLWGALTRVLNALEQAGENPAPTTAGGARLSGGSGGAMWDEDAGVWRTEERY